MEGLKSISDASFTMFKLGCVSLLVMFLLQSISLGVSEHWIKLGVHLAIAGGEVMLIVNVMILALKFFAWCSDDK